LQQLDTGNARGVGGWLFRHRTLIPLPLAAAILLIPETFARGPDAVRVWGVALVAAGEAIRVWAVRHIGVVSRTRSDRLGPLISSGPFALVRNPLYLGNIALWSGLALAARLLWLAPVVVLILAVEYHFIVGWEERLLEQRQGEHYRAYAARVPRWLPLPFRRAQRSGSGRPDRRAAATRVPRFSWRDTLYSERGTLIAIGVGLVLIWLKAVALPPSP
jgi:protein-S-isoprenylcysteine O-methyltransferase Ste14